MISQYFTWMATLPNCTGTFVESGVTKNLREKLSRGIVNFVLSVKKIETQFIEGNPPLQPRDDCHGNAKNQREEFHGSLKSPACS
jgi:hypothetical protein